LLGLATGQLANHAAASLRGEPHNPTTRFGHPANNPATRLRRPTNHTTTRLGHPAHNTTTSFGRIHRVAEGYVFHRVSPVFLCFALD
jgi:hypothetical protein